MDSITVGSIVAALLLGVGYGVLGILLASRVGVQRLLFIAGGLAAVAVTIASLLPVSSRIAVAPAQFVTLHAEGLYPVEKDASGLPFVWSRGDVAFTFDRLIRKPVTLTLDLRSATVAGGPDSPVRIAANGVSLGTVHPEVGNVRPQPYTFTFVPPATDQPQLRITLQTTTFAPAKSDMRQLGTMVTGITLDARPAWAAAARWRWLPWGGLALLALALAAILLAPRAPGLPVGYGAIILSGLALIGVLLFFVVIVRVGVVDRRAYVVWLLSDAILGCCCLAALATAPLGAAGRPSLGTRIAAWWARRTPRVSRIVVIVGRALLLALAAIPILRMAAIVATTGANTLSQDYNLYFAPADRILSGGYPWHNLLRDTWGTQTLYTVPLLIDIGLLHWTHWNIYTDLFLGIGVSVCRLGLLANVFTARSRRPARWLLWPILAALIFSTSQINLFTSALYGTSGLSSHLILCGLALGVWALVRFPDRWMGIALVCVSGVVATLSGALGPLTWPVFLLGLVLLGNRKIMHYVVLLGVGALATFPYLYFLFLRPVAQSSVVAGSPFQPPFIAQAVGYPFAQGYSLRAATAAGIIGLTLGAVGILLLWWARRTPTWRVAVPGLLLMAFSLLHILQLSVVRGSLASWYPSGLMMYWLGLVGLAYALWEGRSAIAVPALWPRLTRHASLVWSMVTLLSLVPLYLTSNLTYEDKVDSMRTRSPVAAACVRAYRSAPPYCVPYVAPVTAPAPITATSLAHLAEPLERHRLSVFAPHQEWTLQGDYIFDTVRAFQAPDVPGIAWSPDLTLTSAPWWDYRHLNLLLYPPNRLTWTLTLPATLTRADFHSAVAISTAAQPAPGADGVTFTIALDWGDGKEQPLFERHLAANAQQWQPFTIPLSAYAGQTVTLRFSTTGGAQPAQDFAMYRYPYIDLDGIAPPQRGAAPAPVQPTDSDLRFDLSDGKQWQTKHMDPVANTTDTWIVGSDPTFLSNQPLTVCLADYTHLLIRMSASADMHLRTMSIEYGLDGDEPTKEIAIPLYPDGALHAYTYDLKLLGAGPQAQLTSMRVRPVLAGTIGAENKIQLTDVRLIRRPGPSACEVP